MVLAGHKYSHSASLQAAGPESERLSTTCNAFEGTPAAAQVQVLRLSNVWCTPPSAAMRAVFPFITYLEVEMCGIDTWRQQLRSSFPLSSRPITHDVWRQVVVKRVLCDFWGPSVVSCWGWGSALLSLGATYLQEGRPTGL